MGAVQTYILNEMKYNIYVSLLSSDSPKNPQNTTGLSDRTPTNQNKAAISSLSVNLGKISQDKLNFAAHISVIPVQKMSFLGGEL